MKLYRKALLPAGFLANAVSCGIKKSGKADLALIYSQLPAEAACCFTNNTFAAAPVAVSRQHLAGKGAFRAIIANSGNANCFTGRRGIRDAQEMARLAAKGLHTDVNAVLVASTGIIGRALQMAKIRRAIPQLIKGLSADGAAKAAKAILTTDTCSKEATARFRIAGRVVSVCGMAKGAGMIAPDMATMLCFITTDATIRRAALRKALKEAVSASFNCISVDGCMSTNDSVMVLANAASGSMPLDAGRGFAAFSEALSAVCLELAKMIVRDAEGATKFITVEVKGARNPRDAKAAALAIANSALFKTAVYGENPNFGRIVAAIGASGAKAREEDLRIRVSPLHKRDINVEVRLGQGTAGATVYTSDLTPAYIRINAAYN